MRTIPQTTTTQSPPPSVSDDSQVEVALVRRLAAGDRDALAALYDRYAVLLHAVGRRMLGDGREVEDVVHDVFLEAWHKAAHYDVARGSVRAWMLLRMRSRCLDRMKSAHERRSRPFGELTIEELGAGPDAPAAFFGRDAERLRRVLGELPLDQRTVLELSYFDGLSGAEIAERLSVPLGTVKSRAAAALGKLRSAFGEPALERSS